MFETPDASPTWLDETERWPRGRRSVRQTIDRDGDQWKHEAYLSRSG
jgi:hypothetical protein